MNHSSTSIPHHCVELTDPRVTPFLSLRGKSELTGHFVAEGIHAVQKLLESSLEVISILALPKYLDLFSELITRRGVTGDQLITVEKSVIHQIAGVKMHQGVMALARRPAELLLQNLHAITTGTPLVALNGLTDASNIGAIVRNCAAFGVNSLITDAASADPYLRRAVRVSQGTLFSMEHYRAGSLVATLRQLREQHGYSVVGATAERGISLAEYTFPEKYVLVLGSEGCGMTPGVEELCEERVTIPMAKGVDSLNVAAASALLLFAGRRTALLEGTLS